ncbi:MAG: redoxin family protein [Ornithinimicrobium sp.]
MSTRHGLIALMTVGAVALAACGSEQSDPADGAAAADVSSSAPGASTTEGGAASAEADVEAAPAGDVADLNFTATTLEGTTFSGADLAGKPAVLWFWAPWCPTCRAQAPAVSDLAEQYDGQVSVVGVGGAAATSEIEAMAQDVNGPIHLIDEPGAVWQHFAVTAQSTYLIIAADGSVVTDGQFLSDEDLRETVAGLVG